MSFKDINLKYSYETGKGDPLEEFYIPVLMQTAKYDRIAGYFSSTSLAIAARGIVGLISNRGKMRIIASPYLSEADYRVIKSTLISPQTYIEDKFLKEIKEIEDEFIKNHLKALGWMLRENHLEIKLAFVLNEKQNAIDNNALFHQKIGILEDLNGNKISFSGSINETASGWSDNVEEFKVFKDWEEGQSSYLNEDVLKFESYWNSRRPNVSVLEVSDAVKDNLIHISHDLNIEVFKNAKHNCKKVEKKVEEKLSLFPYQINAVNMWIENSCNMLFEMATGTGKTRTAIACICEIMKNNDKLVVIISCPQNTLLRQWCYEVKKIGLVFDHIIFADGTNTKWKNELINNLKKITVGFYKTILIFTTHNTGSSDKFIDIINNISIEIPICFVGDEVHGLGAYVAKKGLLEKYRYRIGLSATPKRWFDDVGTKIITDFFGSKSFEFTIGDALTTINPKTNKAFLVSYEYYPVFVKLSDSEFDEYINLSKRISKLTACNKDSDEYQKTYENLLFKRANIAKNAVNKLKLLKEVLDKMNQIRDAFIFVSDIQIDEVMLILKSRKIIAHRYTQEQGTVPESRFHGLSERQFLLKEFREGNYQALVAIKCLDEGIDIPSATIAILMASSTNPREYIQRTGRVIRQSDDKKRALIYDFILEPSLERISNSEFKEFERMIFEKEMTRVSDMSKYAINNAEVLFEINKKNERFL